MQRSMLGMPYPLVVGVEVDGVEGLEGVSDGVSEGVDGLEGSLGVGCSGSGISRVVCTYGVTVTSPMTPNSWVRSVLMFARLEVTSTVMLFVPFTRYFPISTVLESWLSWYFSTVYL